MIKLSLGGICLLLAALTEALIADLTQDTYHYIPIDFDYGANERVTANITFGTGESANPTKTVMDTGSAGFWKWQAGANATYGSTFLGVIGPCLEKVPNGYNLTQSQPIAILNESTTYSYAGNSKFIESSQFVNDTIYSNGGNGPIANVQFAIPDLGIFRQPDDGTCKTPLAAYDASILGIAPSFGQGDYNAPHFRQNLFQTGRTASQTLVMWFDDQEGTLGRLTGGSLFGAIDKSKYTGELIQVPSTTPRFATTINPNITFNGHTYRGSINTNCTLDSGTHGDTLPIASGDESKRFFNNSGGALISLPGAVIAYNGTCGSIPANLNLTFDFGGEEVGQSVNIKIPLRNYARGANVPSDTAAGICRLNLSFDSNCFLGATFNSASFQAFDDGDNSIWLAQGGVSKKGSGVEATVIGPGQRFADI